MGLSGLQVRGHAMFSHEGLPLESETLEYAWMVEAIIGDLTGKLTCPQVCISEISFVPQSKIYRTSAVVDTGTEIYIWQGLRLAIFNWGPSSLQTCKRSCCSKNS